MNENITLLTMSTRAAVRRRDGPGAAGTRGTCASLMGNDCRVSGGSDKLLPFPSSTQRKQVQHLLALTALRHLIARRAPPEKVMKSAIPVKHRLFGCPTKRGRRDYNCAGEAPLAATRNLVKLSLEESHAEFQRSGRQRTGHSAPGTAERRGSVAGRPLPEDSPHHGAGSRHGRADDQDEQVGRGLFLDRRTRRRSVQYLP